MDIKIFASGSKGNAYRISDGQTTLLLDTGISLKALRIALDFNLQQLGGCLITHAHGDHSKAAAALADMGVDIYTSGGTINACGLHGHRIHAVRALDTFTIGSFIVLPFDIQHDAPEPLGFLCQSKLTGEKLLYFTDTFYLKYRFKGLTHIMAECNHDRASLHRSTKDGDVHPALASRVVKTHMSLETLLDMLRANDLSCVRQIYLLHLSDSNSDEERYRREVQRLTGTEVYIC